LQQRDVAGEVEGNRGNQSETDERGSDGNLGIEAGPRGRETLSKRVYEAGLSGFGIAQLPQAEDSIVRYLTGTSRLARAGETRKERTIRFVGPDRTQQGGGSKETYSIQIRVPGEAVERPKEKKTIAVLKTSGGSGKTSDPGLAKGLLSLSGAGESGKGRRWPGKRQKL